MCYRYLVVVLLLLIVGCLQDVFSLRDVKIVVPQAVVRGKSVKLQCLFELEGENLYSVKWYRGEHEFFRYTPTDKESVKIFPVKGIHVKAEDSQATSIILENVSREISGPFSCEVTAERPSFYTLMQTAELKVVDIPRTGPYITGLKKRYSLKDQFFQANCTSDNSYPAANVSWYIDGLHIRGPQIMKRNINNYNGYETVISSIRHRLPENLFVHGSMKIRCSASLYDVYHKSTEVSVLVKRRKLQHPDWPPTTIAPPTLSDEPDYVNQYYENSIAPTPRTTLWFWPSSSSSKWKISSLLITSIAVGNIALLI